MSKSRELKSFLFLLKEHRLVEFFFKELVIAKYKELSYLVRIILTQVMVRQLWNVGLIIATMFCSPT